MEILLALLLMVWGNIVGADQPELTFSKWVGSTITAQTVVPGGGDSQSEAAVPDGKQEDGVSPSWKVDPQKDTAPVVRGIYSTAYSVSVSRFDTLIKMIDETELNSIVIDVKEDKGLITYKMDVPELQELGTFSPIIRDIDQVIKVLEEHDIYPIARIVVFKDSELAAKKPELSFLNADGSVWKNSKKESFVNPYREEVWEYNVDVAKEAARAGFQEIQFDYVRFPEGFEKRADTLKYTQDERSRVEVINDFVKYAYEQLNPLGVRVSVDIFGFAAAVDSADGIGQDFNGISQYVDVISPMVYPSHYSTGWYGSPVPDAAPYQTIDGAMKDTHKKLEEIADVKPIIRPWIQDFTATWIQGHIKYGVAEVEAQIQALYDNDVYEFLLWDPFNKYTQGVNYDLE